MAINKTKLGADVLALVLSGASTPVILEQFLNEKKGNSLTAYKDGGGLWTIFRGIKMIDGKPVVQGMKICDQVNAIERNKTWRGLTVILRCAVRTTESGYCIILPVQHRPQSVFRLDLL